MSEAPADMTRTSVTAPSLTRTSSDAYEALEGRFAPGTLLNGRYRIIALLGKGGMGEVYRATDLTLGQSVALKFLPKLSGSDPRVLERFHNEVRIARQVSHPNVCRVYDIGEAEGLVYLSMEYVDGEDLSTLLRRIGRLPGEKATEIARKICAGLAAAHDQGVIHRDLKPHNVMLNKRGEVLICDFGLAALPDEISPAEYRQGTPAYMAPEQIKGTGVTAQSDIYSLGLVLYELYTGKRPYAGANLQELLAQQEAMSMTSMTSHASDIEPAVENIIKRCLDPEPTRRPASALQVSMALPGGDPLAAALAAGQTPSPELVAASRSTGLSKRYSLPLVAFVLLALVCLPLLKGKIESLEYSPNEMPPAALEVAARRMVAEAGYPDKPHDVYWTMASRGALIQYIDNKTKLRDWYQVFGAEPALLMNYRESPANLATSPYGQVDYEKPGLQVPGMLRLSLNSRGHIRDFEAVPPVSPKAAAGPGITKEGISRWIGMELEKFQPTEPFRTPLTPYEELHCFEGKHPGLASVQLKVQYGVLKGRLTSLYFQWPWGASGTPQSRTNTTNAWLTKVRDAFLFLMVLVFLFYSISLAWRNWKQGRADRVGALRLALARMVLDAIAWTFGAMHLRPEVESFFLVFGTVGAWLSSGLITYILYLALEPALRARWPQAIVTWNRLVSGRWQDPQVDAHVLMGAALGVFLVSFFLGRNFYEYATESKISISPSVMLGGWGVVIGQFAGVLSGALFTGLMLFFVIFGLKVLLKRDWLVVLVASLVLPLTEQQLTQSDTFLLDYASYVLVFAVIFVALMRFGLLTTVVGVFYINMLGRLPANNDFTVWFMPYTIVSLCVLMGLALAAFWRSLGDQSLLGEGN
ncbi:MAG: serine/threonine-protein kinase [Bryobacter sp.]|nr:serine/threonine-protein kinase [Bryobacter sp.]